MKTHVLAVLGLVVGLLIAPSLTCATSDDEPIEALEKLKDGLKEFFDETTLVRQTIDRLDERLNKALLPSSMVNQKELEALQNSTQKLNRFQPKPSPPLYTKEQIRSIAVGPGKTGTVYGAVEEKSRLRAARDARQKEIDNLEETARSAQRLPA